MGFFSLSSLSLLGIAAASPLVVEVREPIKLGGPGSTLPKTYAALGDSYAAGIGSGKFLSSSHDARDNDCARQDGSYPWLLSNYFPDFKSSSTSGQWADFQACSGDVMSAIDGQIGALLGNKVDLVTLSISGNDFAFAEVVELCVYPNSQTKSPRLQGTNFAEACNSAITSSEKTINAKDKWTEFVKVVRKIKTDMLSDDGRIIITGYPRFFNPNPQPGDICDSTYFLNVPVVGKKLAMTAITRRRINAAVNLVNQKIQSEVVSQFQDESVVFQDIDSLYSEHRFCEPEMGKDPIGANNNNVWINDITTDLEQVDGWQRKPPVSARDEPILSDENIANLNNTDVLAFAVFANELRKSSSFHPKKPAGERIALAIFYNILDRVALKQRLDRPLQVTKGPKDIISSSGKHPVPKDCIVRSGEHPGQALPITAYCWDGSIRDIPAQ